MVKILTILKQKQRILMLLVLALASIIFTGCDNGSLGTKSGAISGYVLDSETNAPISEVLVRAKGTKDQGGGTVNKTTYTDGDGSFVIGDACKASWQLSVEKYGYSLLTTAEEMQCEVNNGETFVMSPIRMTKLASGTKGVLRGYPIDAITGRALTNFTISQTEPYNERKSKTFDSAATFRDTGWTNLEGGLHQYTIVANNYEPFKTKTYKSPDGEQPYIDGIEIGKSPFDMGTIKMTPLTIQIGGTLRNLPGYVLNASNEESGLTVWAESGGKVVATYTDLSGEDKGTKLGNINFFLNVPVTAGSVAVKCKLRGYDIVTISSAVSIPSSNPGGIISGVDVDFSTIEPIKTDVRIIFTGKEPEDNKPGSIMPGDTLRAYIQAGGVDIVPYAECIAHSGFGGEVMISGVITGYNINILGVNMTRMFNNNGSDGKGLEVKIPEGTDVFPVIVSFGD